MKIAVIGWELPPAFSGGLGIHTLNLFSVISKFADVDVYIPRISLLYHTYPFHVRFVPLTYNGIGGNYDLLIPEFNSAVKEYNEKVVKSFVSEGVNVIHCHDWITFNAGVELKEKYGIPLVVTVHSTEMDRSGNFYPQKWIMDIEGKGMRAADHIITVSDYTKRLVMETYKIPVEKITTIHNGLGKHFYFLPPKDYDLSGHVLYFGRVTMQKGPKFFIEAAKKVVEKFQGIKFVVAGTGEQMDEMRALAKELSISRNVIFTGFVDLSQAIHFYRTSDAFVLPAVSEPFGITVLEAMSSGTPAIISTTTGVGEALKNVLKADFWDTDLIADYIAGVLKYGSLRKTLGSIGQIEAKRFTWEAAALQTMEVYSEL
ncbi:MAG: glycosyltransferase family 4 protein [Thermoplasmatales archaeon]